MAAYMIVQITINDEQQWNKYRDAVVPLITKFGGKPLVRAGAVELLEGQHDGRLMTMIEFPSMEAIHQFWNSLEYAPVKEIRRGAATLDIWAVSRA
jgi:uncharacterized protein (DUF1330 family)